MEANNGYAQEIDLKDLLFAILRKWRTVLAVAVVLAVLLGGGKAFLAFRASRDVKGQTEKMDAYEREMDSYNTAKESGEREIENINDDIQAQQKYMDESVLMNMSPYDVCEASADLFVKTDYQIMPGMVYQNADYTDSILQAYQSAIGSAAFQENVALVVSLEPQYLKELVSVRRGSFSSGDAQNPGYTRYTNLLTIQVRYSDKEKAQEILNSILADVTALQEPIATTIGPHTVSVVNQVVGSTVDMDLAKLQKDNRNAITDLQKSLTDKEDALKELKEPQAPSVGMSAVVKTGVKYAVLGGILGVFAVAFCISAVFVMSDKVYAAKDIRKRYGLNLLGTLDVPGAKRKSGIDAWLARLEGRRAGVDATRSGELLAANVENYAGACKKLLVTGLVVENQLKDLGKMLQKELKDYELVVGANMLESAETLRKLPECDGVVLVEQEGFSSYADLTQEIEKVKSMDKPVVGCVVYEN